jgi:hypothetical protein
MTVSRNTVVLGFFAIIAMSQAYPEQGRFTLSLNDSRNMDGVAKNFYNNTKLYVKVSCSGADSVRIGWVLRETHVSIP